MAPASLPSVPKFPATVAGGVYAGIVFHGFDLQNVENGNKENPLLVLHHKAVQRAETTEGLEQWFETSICCPALFDDLECVNQGLGKSLLIIWLQQIVNSVDFECADGMGILSLNTTLGVFLLVAAKQPAKHRLMVAYGAWSTLAHGITMTIMSAQAVAHGMPERSRLQHLIGGCSKPPVFPVLSLFLVPFYGSNSSKKHDVDRNLLCLTLDVQSQSRIFPDSFEFWSGEWFAPDSARRHT